eukprot:TRINITY_DN38377_c0_g1_i1.p1 TRINITY_DN38377_c0_g1~~TRINITY_DN38377_c0_g1_i1.p1  ORF type:complete len:352 (-),score=39.48 TRINITY_DN38377_c0_g1_i1:259-1314(-)
MDGLRAMADAAIAAFGGWQRCCTVSVPGQSFAPVVGGDGMPPPVRFPIFYVLSAFASSKHLGGPRSTTTEHFDFVESSKDSSEGREGFANYDGRPQGGLCTQSLLAVLRGGWQEVSEEDTQHVSFAELVTAMYQVVASVGFPRGVVTLRSSVELGQAYGGSVADALPCARNCGDAPRALLVGIEYADATPEWKLEGSWCDVEEMRTWLQSSLAWPAEAVRLLTDSCGPEQVTKDSIVQNLEWLIEDDGPDENWPYHGSGRGCRLLQFCGRGGKSVLFPVDWQRTGPISEMSLFQTVQLRLPKNATFTFVLDICSPSASEFFAGLRYDLRVPAVDQTVRRAHQAKTRMRRHI